MSRTITISITVPDGVEVEVSAVESPQAPPPTVLERRVQVRRSSTLTYDAVTHGEYRAWTDDEIQVATDATLTHREVCELLDEFPYQVVVSRRNLLGVKFGTRTVEDAPNASARWSREEDDALLKFVPIDADRRTADFEGAAGVMGRTVASLRARHLRLKKWAEEKEG